MKEIKFKLEIFEGPLDLMLSLISKHKLNIQDIEITVLLRQYLDYIEKAGENDIELAGEFLETAAYLIYIKTVSLLPKHEAEKLKKELEGALIEYALCKATAEKLREYYIGDLIFTRLPEPVEIDLTYNISHTAEELIESAVIMADRKRNKEPVELPAYLGQEEISYVSVFSKIVNVMKRVKKGGKLKLQTLFEGQTRSEQVATFLALLQLSTHNRIAFSKDMEHIEFNRENQV
jgi:segregation and condensation protein A